MGTQLPRRIPIVSAVLRRLRGDDDHTEAIPVAWILVAAPKNGTPASGTPAAFDPGRIVLANFGRRFAALLIDWALCLLIAGLYADPRVIAWPPVVALIVINTIFIGLFGQTPGMALAGIRCVSVRDGGAIGLGRAVIRAVLLALLIPALIMDESRRGWHDRAAGSVVVKARGRES